MNNKTTINMEDHTMLIALISALGVKELWNIWKKKIDVGAKKNEREDSLYARQVEILSNKIEQLEVKIDELIKENTHLKIKIVKMENRLISNAKKKVETKRYKNEKS
tara:strand:+ start:3614 stop:3934 length:321 start_codon:yes stop_codon:yes gene_type:complete